MAGRFRAAQIAVLAALLAAGVSPAVARAARTAPLAPPVRLLAEKDINLDEADRVAANLTAAGVDVLRTRVDDTFVALGDRTAAANAAGSDLFVSIHNNASTNHAIRGTEVYSQVGRDASIALGQSIIANVTRRAGTSFRGVFQRSGRDTDYYFVLRNSRMPAVIVEGAYVSSPEECLRLAGSEIRQQTADGIAAGMLSALGPLPDNPGAALGPPTANPLGEHLAAPPNLVVHADRASSTIAWDTVAKATGYRLWRDGQLIATIRTSNDDLALHELAGENTGPPRLVVDQAGPGIGTHHYELRAMLEVHGGLFEESPSTAAAITLPWRVTIDAGHGGHDPGAVGRY